MRLFKYRFLNTNTLDSLLNSYFWAASKESLNDPFEFKYTTKAIEKEIGIFNSLSHKSSLNKEKYISTIKSLNQDLGIFSLAKSANIQSLWNHYADEHKGICIEYDLDELTANNEPLYQKLDVLYSDSVPDLAVSDIHSNTLVSKMFATKSKDWAYEQEFRLISNIQGKNFHRPEAIKTIIFGLNVIDNKKNEIIRLLSNTNIEFKEVIEGNEGYSHQIQQITKPIDNKTLMSNSQSDLSHILPLEKDIEDAYRIFFPYLNVAGQIMSSKPYCLEIHDIYFSNKSTLENPIIYVNFVEKESRFAYSQKLFSIDEIKTYLN